MSVEQQSLRALARVPLIAFAALCALLASTIGLAYVPLGPLNLVISLTIATAKVAIIALVFMELRRAEGVIRLAALAGVLWLSFLFLLTAADYLSR